MVKIENQCCGCAVPGYPCRGSACTRRRVAVHYCDNPVCGCELPDDEIYEVDGCEVCEDCFEKSKNKEQKICTSI